MYVCIYIYIYIYIYIHTYIHTYMWLGARLRALSPSPRGGSEKGDPEKQQKILSDSKTKCLDPIYSIGTGIGKGGSGKTTKDIK